MLLAGRRIDRWIRERKEGYPHVTEYLATTVHGRDAKIAMEEEILAYEDLFWPVVDRAVGDIVALFADFSEEEVSGDDYASIFDAVRGQLGVLPHETQFEEFEEVVDAFYDRPVYPLLEHLMYTTSIGLERLRQVTEVAAHAPSIEGGRLADLGIGPAVISSELLGSRPDWTGVGVDVSEHCVRYAQSVLERRGLGDRTEVLRGDARDLSLADQSLDLVVATEIVEHVPDPKQLLLEIARVLKPGACAIASAPTNLPWGPHLTVFKSEEEVRALFDTVMDVKHFQAVPFIQDAKMTFGLLQKR